MEKGMREQYTKLLYGDCIKGNNSELKEKATLTPNL
jgi:hypothetical protein